MLIVEVLVARTASFGEICNALEKIFLFVSRSSKAASRINSEFLKRLLEAGRSLNFRHTSFEQSVGGSLPLSDGIF